MKQFTPLYSKITPIENKLHLCKRRNDGKYNRKFLFFY